MCTCKMFHLLLVAVFALAQTSSSVDASLKLLPILRGINNNNNHNEHHRELPENGNAQYDDDNNEDDMILRHSLPALERVSYDDDEDSSPEREVGLVIPEGINRNDEEDEEELQFDDLIRGGKRSDPQVSSSSSSSSSMTNEEEEELLIPYLKAKIHDRKGQIMRDAVHTFIHDLLNQFAKYELNRHRQQQQHNMMMQQQTRQTPQAAQRAEQQTTGTVIGKRLWGQRRNVQTRFASFGTKLTPNRKMLLGGSGNTLLRYGRSTN